MKTLELECDEIADLKMMRDDLDTVPNRVNFEGRRRLNLLNKIIDHVKASRPEREGFQIR